jgi:hypothetical protein
MACIDCNDVDINTGADGYNGWSPILALVEGTCDGDAVTVHQLVSWQDGSGTRPIYSGNIMTDPWLLANPIYLGSTGFVTDICDATNLTGGSGGAGTPGGTGPEGPEGPAGCSPIAELNFEFTNGGETLSPPVDVVVTVDDTDPCNPIYDVSIDARDLFTNTDLITALVGTTTFIDYINSLLGASVGGVNGINNSPTISDTGTPDVFWDGNLSIGNLIFTSTALNTNFFKWNILGNRMTLDFLLNIQKQSSNSDEDFLLELKIPGGYAVSSTVYPESNAVAVTIGELGKGTEHSLHFGERLQGTPVITTYQASQGANYLLLGVTPNALDTRPSNQLVGFNFRNEGLPDQGYCYRIQGQLTFTIDI